MSLIEKIDAEMQWLNERLDTARIEHDKLGIWKTKGMIYEAEKMKEIILSEQKEPCEYCTENPCWLCKHAGECQTWQHCSSNNRSDYRSTQNYCHICGRPLNQPYTEVNKQPTDTRSH